MTKEKIPFWRDSRILNIVGQAIILLIVFTIIGILGNNLVRNFQRLGLTFGFNFLSRSASFGIGNSPISYSPTDPYTKAILVGLLNSLQVMFFGIIIASTIGIIVGISRLSNNWLVRQLATIYVETLRNTPLLLQLFFWYFAVFLRLPKVDNPVTIGKVIYLTNRGMDIPWLVMNIKTRLSLIFIIFSIILAIIFWRKRLKNIEERGESGQVWLWLFVGIIIAVIAVFLWVIDWQIPQLQENNITGGINLSPELATLLIGLSIYTAAFIAEVVRAGIQSVSKGQWEAARALGLKPGLVMQLVIFPQALRVMIPPLTSEFLNLAKNSSLAIAIGYNDLYAISSTISNQTGRSIEMLLVVMITYLTINLIISSIMNRFNRSVQLQER
ncbi:polar amino acid ABC transporter, inner membrane subunit [Stanieria sp. NIES-3757]|nr:polar amino acid ABC transporter, inner membrane subunit [Stanieria sp. NIES-3757]